MNLNKLFRNPEAKKITIKYIAVTLCTIIIMFISSYYLAKEINKKVLENNISIYARIINNEDSLDIMSKLFKVPSKENIKEAKLILNEYGYNEDLSLDSNEIEKHILKSILIVFMPIFIIILTLLYLMMMKELKGIYIKIDNIVLNTKSMSEGEYKKIDGSYTEGEMAILISSLNYMGDRVNNSINLLQEDKENLKDFLSDISHQLKTPLASLVMFNDLLKDNKDMPYEDRERFLKASEEQLTRMEWLIMNLLKMGRLEANSIKFECFKQDLKETIDLAISSLKPLAISKNQELIITGDIEAEIIHDREWLAEAISNIVKNAIEHTQKEGKIEILVVKGSLITKILIKDNGVGIPKEVQDKVFKRFYKGDSSVNPKSIGIGLSLAKSIIEKQGGEIKLTSEEGKGTTFIISFLEM